MTKLFRSLLVAGVAACAALLPATRVEALSITGISPVTENFDSMAATLNLPATGWRMAAKTNAPTWAIGVAVVTAQASSGAPSAGGTYNWGATGATDRAVGAMTSGSFGSPNSLMVAVTNDSGLGITNLAVNYNVEVYRTNTAAASVQLYYSTDGSTWNIVTGGDVPAASLPTGPSTYGYPSRTIATNANIGSLAVAAGGVIYLRWNLNTTGSSSQGIGVDDVSLTASLAVIAGAPDAVATLTATVVSASQIDLAWTPNAATDLVLVAYATNSVFGSPSGTYTASNAISGGGEVLYVGALTNVSHLGLTQNKLYYYRAFSVSGTTYSASIGASATTPIAFPPSLSITNPPLASNDVPSSTTFVDLQGFGTNLANNMTWSNRNTGAVGTMPAAASWVATNVPLAAGVNRLVVGGSNADGFVATPVTTIVVRALQAGVSPSDATVWVNEFHYDNVGTDTNEGFEIAGPAGVDLSTYSLALYSGNGGLLYNTIPLAGVIDNEGCGFGAVWFDLPVNGLQNGGSTNVESDGFALLNGTNVIQFLSYEGGMTASDGPAAGYQSLDIGVFESNIAIGVSLQLVGSATSYAGFGWADPAQFASYGVLNSNQTISSCGNVPPVIGAIGNQICTNGGVFTLPVSASDIDGDVIELTASNLPPGAVFAGATNATTANSSLVWSPVGAVGVYTTTFFAVDNDGLSTQTITITVIAGVPPVLNPVTNLNVALYGSVSLPVTALPTEGDTVTLTASNLPAGASFVATNATGTLLWPSASPAGTYSISLYATDDDGSSSQTVTVKVERTVATFGSTVVLYQGFEAPDTWSIVEGAAQISTNTGAGDTPANQRIFAGTSSWQVINVAATATLAHAAISGYTNRCVAVRVSSTSTNATNGADSSVDQVRLYVALNGAAFSTNSDLLLGGNNNARWGYNAVLEATGNAGTPVTYAAPQASESLNNYAQLVVALPDAATSLAVRVVAVNNFTGECWSIDDIRVLGSVGFPASTDDDGDLLPNVWEFQYFAGNTNATATTDNDNDGFDNLSEYIAGTVPTNGASFLKLDAILNSNVTGRAITFSTVTGRLYDVRVSADLLSGGWSNLQTGVSGSGAPIAVNDNAGDTNRFYSIGVQLAP